MLDYSMIENESERTVSNYLAQWLIAQNISHIFTLPGGMIAPILDAIHRYGETEIVTMHHEQGVAFAADGASRFHGRPFVALATAGPGATNMLTPIASTFLDSIPAIFITGQVQSYLLKGERPVRQFGFQECDIASMAAPVTKAAWRAASAEQVPAMLDDAIRLAIGGRPGPVLIELPSDVQTQVIPADARPLRAGTDVAVFSETELIVELFDALTAAERPMVLIGGGVRAAHAARRARTLLKRLNIPVAASVTALDVLPHEEPLRLGMIGMYGNRWVNLAMSQADVVLVLGSRLDFGTIGADVAGWGRSRKIFQVDCDPAEMGRVRRAQNIVADLMAFIDAAMPLARARDFPERKDWHKHLAELREQWPDTDELAGCQGINPNEFMRRLSLASPAAAAFVIDEGQHLFWACQSIRLIEGQRLLPALGLGPCGWAFPAAIGIAHTASRPVVLVAGDGAFQFNIQELQTVVRGRLPIKMVIVDNGSHGSVRQLQEQAFGSRYPATVLGYDTPDFAAVARAYGIESRELSEPEDVDDSLNWLWRDPAAPALLHVRIATDLNVYPNVPFGAPISHMETWQRTASP